jgi:hypothetical protein
MQLQQKLFFYLTSSGLQIVNWDDATHSFSNHLPIKFHVTLYGIWSKSLLLIQTPSSLSSRLTMIYFADYASDSIVSTSPSSLEKNLKEISRYFRHFLSLYSAVLGNVCRVEFLPDHGSQKNQPRILDDGKPHCRISSHTLTDGFPTAHILKVLRCPSEPGGDSQVCPQHGTSL